MDDRVRAIISEVMPDLPNDLAEEWLAPYVKDLGPPTPFGRWPHILAGRSLEFWRRVRWRLDSIDLASANFTSTCEIALGQMAAAYFMGHTNPFSEILDGKDRTLRVLAYLEQHRKLPKPPALLLCSDGSYETIDGNHRLLAFRLAMTMKPPTADPNQRVWIGSAT